MKNTNKNNIDKLFLEECNAERAEHEKENYSEFNRHEIYEIKKYIDEKPLGIRTAIANADDRGKTLFIAPTGAGKSYSFINTLKKLKTKALFILPNASNVEQAMHEYSVAGAYDKIPAKQALKGNNLVVMTWDKTEQLIDVDLSEYIIVVDEIHQTYTDAYRAKAIKNLNNIMTKCKGRIDITATPTKLEFEIYDYIIEYTQTQKTKYNVKLYNDFDNKNFTEIINIINKSKNSAMLMNDISTLEFIRDSVDKNADVVYADGKEENELYNRIVKNSDMKGYETLLNTTTILAGVNIKNKNITDIIIVNIKDVGAIKQYVARFRNLKKANIHIFNKYDEECNIYKIEWLVNKNIEKATILKEAYNKVSKHMLQFETVGINATPIRMDSNVYYCTKDNCYKVDKLYIKSQVYSNYYNTRTIQSFKVLLEEYFENIEIADIKENITNEKELKEYKKVAKEIKDATREILKEHKEILVGYRQIKSDSKSFKLMQYHNDMKLSSEGCLKAYKEYDIHNLVKKSKSNSMLELYSNYVLDNKFSLELAWKLANTANRKRGAIFNKINTLIYRELKEEYPQFLNDELIEVTKFNYIDKLFGVGTSYTKVHLQELTNDLRLILGEVWDLNTKKLEIILNGIFVIENKNYRSGSVLEHIFFYKNINPNTEPGTRKRIRINNIKRYITIDDIKQELELDKKDNSLEHAIEYTKDRMLNSLDEEEKLLLLKGLM
ncbi:DEAD/DEAH box helicase family protein [Clostridioides difficile]|uniref:DEAD/DEAH box helicase family protein n=1 Tax=Clostridioides difficile TaxID=1496 RepID=UPI000A9DD433|nr:DEAD/DEAH box helicase family protein [Clostridioides difficile]MBH7225062.1 DEAD/DEAH box helicase family protein [Clostridioides difficile]MCR1382282.1 DEAD/DEAH box helicase family protein [Clostridioides difficile]MCR1411486.1 DEAD/DEAH box helicase family protein [Clostridioides difficile]MCW0758750.1 DEAD/DEAH box helicase family protein [Clostridioides difficile]MDK3213475.1 DEAD/DEAH box helicase family protein [Clostridioides difficile]